MKWTSHKVRVGVLAFTVFCTAIADGGEAIRDPLFHIERNKNANIVQYDAQLTDTGMLDEKQPVVAYWVRHAEQGQVKKLSWLQKKFAYGFKAKLNEARNTAVLDMAVNPGRTIMVRLDDDDYRAIADINGVACYVDRVFIHARGKGLTTRVDFIDWYGRSVDSGEHQHERFSP